ncbi:MAG: ABC transporter ATP-binding protein [Actinobacteria bacterium 13_1_20CM_2_65_11]|nr:MAG: ABC transporter ATP-binding protein [Actinobacteria bacterium 13_1_40CM_2_65_8]OLE80760.1 MAG: ABC transporter ATP-binding protein [Actinobacteria bacterium 13_1_20CM_2_65_11]
MSVLELRDVEVEYSRSGRTPVRAVAGASLSVDAGQIVGLVGETGCGKSTLARAAVGLVAPTAGSVWFEGRELRPIGRRARSRTDARLQMVFQNPFSSLNPRRRVGDQIADGMAILGLVPANRRRERVSALLEQVGLPAAAARRFPHQYSGGQRQRIAIARALAAQPSVIVLDEPLSSLDASAQAQVANLLTGLARELRVGLLLISHDLAIVRHIADTVAVMYLGLLVETAPTRRLWSAPLHPYTEALIEAIPRADGKGWLPESLPGEVPDPARPPAGCRFHPRCPYAFAKCRSESPPLLDVASGRRVACWLHEHGDAERAPSTFASRTRESSGAGDQVDGV